MRIRSELNMPWIRVGPETGLPMAVDAGDPALPEPPELNPDLHSPEDARLLAALREHLIEHPEGALLDAYQAVTGLELKHPSGSDDARDRYLEGLRGEIGELHSEIMQAQHLDHPYQEFGQETEDASETWLIPLLDHSRLRHTHLTPERREHILGELGDVLWYCSRIAAETGVTLSDAFMRFLYQSHAGEKLKLWYDHGWRERIQTHAGNILTFETVQEIALSQKGLESTVIDKEADPPKKATIDNMPHIILQRIEGDELFRQEPNTPEPTGERPYAHLPHIEVTIGKLIWFVTYTSHTLLNEDFSTVMRANLEKVGNRAQRGTLFSKRLRDEQDESAIRATGHRRMPMH